MAAVDNANALRHAGPVYDGRGPFVNGVAVVPSDTVDLANVSLALHVGVGGTLSLNLLGTGAAVSFTCVAGELLPVRATRVLAAGTSASAITALW
jgi:hypothetical protein